MTSSTVTTVADRRYAHPPRPPYLHVIFTRRRPPGEASLAQSPSQSGEIKDDQESVRLALTVLLNHQVRPWGHVTDGRDRAEEQMKEDQSHEARRRAFIREHHPDRGGDPGAFIAGLRALDAQREQGSGPLPEVVVVRRRPWLVRKATAVVRHLRYGPRPSRVRLVALDPGRCSRRATAWNVRSY